MIFLLPMLAALGPLLPVVGSVFAFRLATLLLVFIVVVRNQTRRLGSALRSSTWVLLAVAVLSTLALVIVHGIDEFAASELNSCFFGVVLVIAVLFARVDTALFRAMLFGWMLAVTVTGVLAFYELRTGWRASNYFANRDLESVLTDPGLASSFGNPNDFAYFLLMALLILLAGFSLAHSRAMRLALVVYALAVALMVLGTESTLGLVVLGTIVLGVVLTRIPFAPLVVVPAIMVIAVVASNSAGGLTSLFGVNVVQSSLFNEGQTGAVRLNLLTNGLQFSAETSFLGLGPGGYETRTAQIHPGDLPTQGILSPHSAIMEVLSQYGVFVFVSAVVVVLLIANTGWRAYRSQTQRRGLKLTGLVLMMYAALAPLMSMMASSSLEPSYSWMSFASMLLIALWLKNGYGDTVAERSEPETVGAPAD